MRLLRSTSSRSSAVAEVISESGFLAYVRFVMIELHGDLGIERFRAEVAPLGFEAQPAAAHRGMRVITAAPVHRRRSNRRAQNFPHVRPFDSFAGTGFRACGRSRPPCPGGGARVLSAHKHGCTLTLALRGFPRELRSRCAFATVRVFTRGLHAAAGPHLASPQVMARRKSGRAQRVASCSIGDRDRKFHQ
jgi:hypothetical protein